MSLYSSQNLSYELCFDNEILQSEVNSNQDVKKKKKSTVNSLSLSLGIFVGRKQAAEKCKFR